MQVRIIRSANRRRTVQARVVNGEVVVRVPQGMAAEEESRVVERLHRRLERRSAAKEVDLAERAGRLADRHRLPLPSGIRWVSNQETLWGSCTPATGQVRISDRMSGMPLWVLDYVLVHELAHISQPGHGPAFWRLVDRYPLSERARGYLMASGAGADLDGTDIDPVPA
ncbi:MAG: M48 family metallopeptidase [Actinomycetota bacterium]|nr:M48 family metallopeptidase [Actinomycetota bacterium]